MGTQRSRRSERTPNRLALDIRGIGFKTADAIAHRLGIPHDSLIRAQAGVRHVLQETATDGHCAAYREQLAESAGKLLEIPAAVIAQAITAELEVENLVAEEIEGRPALFLTPLQRAERGIAMSLHRLQRAPPIWGRIDPQGAIPWVERRTGLALSDSHRAAVATTINGKITIITIITGGPGVGKTTVVNGILRAIHREFFLALYGFRTALECAGKAARQSNLSDGEYQPRWPGIRALSATRAAATALSPGRKAGVGDGCIAKSKAAAGPCSMPTLW